MQIWCRFALAGFLVGLGGASALAQEWADLKMRIVYGGNTIPERKPLTMTADPVCATKTSNDEKMIVNPANKGIQNTALWVEGKKSGLGKGDVHPELRPREEKIILDNKDCVFIPHVIIAQVGETIEVINSDRTSHNANFNLFNGTPQNFLIPIGGKKTLKLETAEPGLISVVCNVHQWMEAKLMVIDHPYGAVTDENGVLSLSKLPAGKPLTFKIAHENSAKSLDEATVGGKKQEWKRGNFELTLKPGMNDLGDVVIDASKFK